MSFAATFFVHPVPMCVQGTWKFSTSFHRFQWVNISQVSFIFCISIVILHTIETRCFIWDISVRKHS